MMQVMNFTMVLTFSLYLRISFFSFSQVCIYIQYFLNIVFLKDVNTNENICSPLHFTLLACKKVLLVNIKSRNILEISIVYPTV